jgi:acetylornithine deacetylase/succinyl-diaminopimelate desuccinylase-like protein
VGRKARQNHGDEEADPNLAHRADERVDVAQITAATEMLRRFLTG